MLHHQTSIHACAQLLLHKPGYVESCDSVLENTVIHKVAAAVQLLEVVSFVRSWYVSYLLPSIGIRRSLHALLS